MKQIPYGKQWIFKEDIEAVNQVLNSDWLTQGPKIKEFEQSLAQYCQAKYAVAVSSGTAALHLAMLAAKVKENDLVLTSPITFVASANCALYANAQCDFVDIDSKTVCLDNLELAKYIEKKSKIPKVVIPVDFAGHPCNMEKIYELANIYNFLVVEDACHALGAMYKTNDGSWVKVGSCRHAHMTVFSFHPVKHITTGEGGAITTNDRDLYERLLLLRTHGITRDTKKRKAEPWFYEMQELGFNYRITDIQCSLGLEQLKKIDLFINRRRQLANIYLEELKGIPELILPFEEPWARSAYHIFPIQVVGIDRRELFNMLLEKNIGVNVHYIPVHLQPYYRNNFGYQPGDFPLAERYYQRAITLPLFPKMTEEEQKYIIKTIKTLIKSFKKN